MDTPSVIDTLAAILAAIRTGNAGKYLPPWDANTYFDLPVTSGVSLAAATTTQLLTANPFRVGVFFSCVPAAGATCWISPNPDVGTAHGWALVSSTPSIGFSHGDYGRLVAGEWWANLSGSNPASIWIGQLLLHDWTKGG